MALIKLNTPVDYELQDGGCCVKDFTLKRLEWQCQDLGHQDFRLDHRYSNGA